MLVQQRYTQDSLVEAYQNGLPGWEASVEDGCANADPSFCDEIVFASFVRGDERIGLNLDNWSVGRFEIGVDARGASDVLPTTTESGRRRLGPGGLFSARVVVPSSRALSTGGTDMSGV